MSPMDLASPASRAGLLEVIGERRPLIRAALETILDRGDFTRRSRRLVRVPRGRRRRRRGLAAPVETAPAIVTGLIERSDASIAALRSDIRSRSGPALFDFLLEAFEEHKRVLGDPLSMQAIMAGMEATWWLERTAGGLARREERGGPACAPRRPRGGSRTAPVRTSTRCRFATQRWMPRCARSTRRRWPERSRSGRGAAAQRRPGGTGTRVRVRRDSRKKLVPSRP